MKYLLLIFVILLSSCSSNSWTGFAYPYGVSNESTWEIKEGFNSLDECRDWIGDVLPNNSVADYECGKNCKHNSTYGMNICEETVK